MSNVVFATQGACSSHDGVSCVVGADLDGSVICNDGWSDSEVSFYEADECHTCVRPSSTGCKNENDYGALRVKLNFQGGYLGSSASYQSALSKCRNEIDSYQRLLDEYNECVSTSDYSSGSEQGTYSFDYSAYKEAFMKEQMGKWCIDNYGDESNYDYENNICFCSEGFITSRVSNQCVSHKKFCEEITGPLSSYVPGSNGSCQCQEGYIIGDDGICVVGDEYCISKNGAGSWLNFETMRCSLCEENGVRGIYEDGVCVFPESEIKIQEEDEREEIIAQEDFSKIQEDEILEETGSQFQENDNVGVKDKKREFSPGVSGDYFTKGSILDIKNTNENVLRQDLDSQEENVSLISKTGIFLSRTLNTIGDFFLKLFSWKIYK